MVTRMSCAKTTEPIAMSRRMLTHVGPENHSLESAPQTGIWGDNVPANVVGMYGMDATFWQLQLSAAGLSEVSARCG